MKISALGKCYTGFKEFSIKKQTKTNYANKWTCDVFNKRVDNFQGVSFKGKPWELNYILHFDMSAKEAISIFDNFKLGNYLDIPHKTWSGEQESAYSAIRKRNLAFLDKIIDEEEKKKFIEYYKNLTGFPDLKKVSDKIIIEFVNAVDKASTCLKENIYNSQYANIVKAGYNSTCSVGKNKAFPGSDLDGAYIIINGSENLVKDDDIVNQFKGYLWNNTDQRILSYNHEAAFPQVYTLAQIRALLNKANEITDKMKLKEDLSFFNYLFSSSNATTQYERYEELLGKYHTDFVKANKFFIDICKYLPNNKGNLSNNEISVELLKNFGFMLESYREGSYFTHPLYNNKPTFYYNFDNDIKNSEIYNLVNLGQTRAFKRYVCEKPKLKTREELNSTFNNWSIDNQYDLIKTIIKASCEENESYKYPEYFRVSANNYKPLLVALGMKC